jgi:hypothetical protein
MGTDRLFNLSEKLGNIGSWEIDIVGCKNIWSDQLYRIC